MSETAEDRQYYAAAEAAFIRRRGTPFLLSPRDFALVKQWRALGVPIEAVDRGIDEAFARREERGAVGRVNSLAYCRDAVLETWERRSETAVGRGTGRAAPAIAIGPTLEELARRVRDVLKRRPELSEPLESALRSLEKLRNSGRKAEEVEASLARLDKRLAGALFDALPAEEKGSLDAEVEKMLGRARVRLDEEAAVRTAKALRRRLLRQALELPRLSLL
ncbi:MAG TPA: hypothetical protein VER78_06605 [Thermoanaerobaculia bacterium]|nr:hypothetical protein [Thermoanaerobaculia bacterium]